MSRRYQSLGKRDANEKPIYDALLKAGCEVERGTDVDLFVAAPPSLGFKPYLMEIKIPGQESSLTALQAHLAIIYGPMYVVVSSPEMALKAVGFGPSMAAGEKT